MRCEELGERLATTWEEAPSGRTDDELEEHLAGCASCRAEAESLERLWRELGRADDAIEVPSERLRARFYRFLAAEEARRERPGRLRALARALGGLWPRRPALQMATAGLALLVGLALGTAVAGTLAASRLEAARSELESVSESVSVALASHPAAAERLRAVELAARADGDQRIVETLLDLAADDSSVNVRLAAIEALSTRLGQAGVGARLLGTLPEQRSPLVQMTLLDIFLPGQAAAVWKVGQPMLERPQLDEAVRRRLLEAGRSAA